jgi:hypothetical protein
VVLAAGRLKAHMNEIASLWRVHRDASWPNGSSPHEGELMTLDTVITGCVTYYLESADGLDAQRVAILEDCLSDLEGLLPDLDRETGAYFDRLRTLACLLLARPAP